MLFDDFSFADNIAVPDFNFGAMENWGLMIYRQAILYEPGVTSASYEYWAATVIAHEIAHMVTIITLLPVIKSLHFSEHF